MADNNDGQQDTEAIGGSTRNGPASESTAAAAGAAASSLSLSLSVCPCPSPSRSRSLSTYHRIAVPTPAPPHTVPLVLHTRPECQHERSPRVTPHRVGIHCAVGARRGGRRAGWLPRDGGRAPPQGPARSMRHPVGFARERGPTRTEERCGGVW